MTECPVCFEDCESARTPCGHAFCDDCLRRIDAENATPPCPLCRAALPRWFLNRLWRFSEISVLDCHISGRAPRDTAEWPQQRRFAAWTEIQISSVTVALLHSALLARTRASMRVLDITFDGPTSCVTLVRNAERVTLVLPQNVRWLARASSEEQLSNQGVVRRINRAVSSVMQHYAHNGLPEVSSALVVLTDAFALTSPAPGQFLLARRPG
jgi:hypothetical protein